MKGCARTCLLWIAGWAAASYAFYVYFIRLHDFETPTYWAAGVAGLSVIFAFAYLFGIVAAYRERSMLLDAVSGTPPADGKWVSVSGTISSAAPLRAPISGERAVAYEYKIQRMEGHGKNRSMRVYFSGKALAPSTISTRQGSIRLLAVPNLNDIAKEKVPPEKAIANATAYIASTTFETDETPKEQRTTMEKESTDDDGQFRKDVQSYRKDVELSEGFDLEEKCVRSGEQVCAFGLYSQMRGGLIPHPNWSKEPRLMRGDASAVAAQLRSRMIKYAVGVVIASGIAYAILRVYEYQALAAV